MLQGYWHCCVTFVLLYLLYQVLIRYGSGPVCPPGWKKWVFLTPSILAALSMHRLNIDVSSTVISRKWARTLDPLIAKQELQGFQVTKHLSGSSKGSYTPKPFSAPSLRVSFPQTKFVPRTSPGLLAPVSQVCQASIQVPAMWFLNPQILTILKGWGWLSWC